MSENNPIRTDMIERCFVEAINRTIIRLERKIEQYKKEQKTDLWVLCQDELAEAISIKTLYFMRHNPTKSERKGNYLMTDRLTVDDWVHWLMSMEDVIEENNNE